MLHPAPTPLGPNPESGFAVVLETHEEVVVGIYYNYHEDDNGDVSVYGDQDVFQFDGEITDIEDNCGAPGVRNPILLSPPTNPTILERWALVPENIR